MFSQSTIMLPCRGISATQLMYLDSIKHYEINTHLKQAEKHVPNKIWHE